MTLTNMNGYHVSDRQYRKSCENWGVEDLLLHISMQSYRNAN